MSLYTSRHEDFPDLARLHFGDGNEDSSNNTENFVAGGAAHTVTPISTKDTQVSTKDTQDHSTARTVQKIAAGVFLALAVGLSAVLGLEALHIISLGFGAIAYNPMMIVGTILSVIAGGALAIDTGSRDRCAFEEITAFCRELRMKKEPVTVSQPEVTQPTQVSHPVEFVNPFAPTPSVDANNTEEEWDVRKECEKLLQAFVEREKEKKAVEANQPPQATKKPDPVSGSTSTAAPTTVNGGADRVNTGSNLFSKGVRILGYGFHTLFQHYEAQPLQ